MESSNPARAVRTMLPHAPKLHTRAAELISAGYYIAPAIEYALLTPAADRDSYTATDFDHSNVSINLWLGKQRSGLLLALIDLDSHHEGQNADEAKRILERERPELAGKVCWRRSRGGKGWHGFVQSHKRLPSGKIIDQHGQHLGEILSNDDQRTLDPGDIQLVVLNKSEVERLIGYWTIQSSIGSNGDRWSDRSKEGMKYIGGAYRYQYSEADLVHFLRNYCNKLDPRTGKVIKRIGEDYLDGDRLTKKVDNRSDRAGQLMQTIMLYIRRANPKAGFIELIQRSYMLWRASDSFGKALTKNYNPERDGASLIAQIIHGDSYGPKDANGQHKYRWLVPHWAKAHPTPIVAPAPVVAVPVAPVALAAHRPAGDRARMLKKIRRYLELQSFDTEGKIYYSASDMADMFGVARRTMQSYLAEIPEIQRGQDGGPGGRAWLIWCADNSELTAEIEQKPAPIWCADEIPIESIATPETTNQTNVCIVDHQDICVPASQAPAAAPAGAQRPGGLPSEPDPFWFGIEEELAAFIPPTAPEPCIREYGYSEMLIQQETKQARYEVERASAKALAPSLHLSQQRIPIPVEPLDRWPADVWSWSESPMIEKSIASGWRQKSAKKNEIYAIRGSLVDCERNAAQRSVSERA